MQNCSSCTQKIDLTDKRTYIPLNKLLQKYGNAADFLNDPHTHIFTYIMYIQTLEFALHNTLQSVKYFNQII